MADLGFIRSVGSNCFVQFSHWSPRASGEPQFGHSPSI